MELDEVPIVAKRLNTLTIRTHTGECTVTTCRATKTFIVRKGGGFFYGSKSGNENYIESL